MRQNFEFNNKKQFAIVKFQIRSRHGWINDHLNYFFLIFCNFFFASISLCLCLRNIPRFCKFRFAWGIILNDTIYLAVCLISVPLSAEATDKQRTTIANNTRDKDYQYILDLYSNPVRFSAESLLHALFTCLRGLLHHLHRLFTSNDNNSTIPHLRRKRIVMKCM